MERYEKRLCLVLAVVTIVLALNALVVLAGGGDELYSMIPLLP